MNWYVTFEAEDGKFQSIWWEFDVSKIIANSVLHGLYSPFSRISSIPPTVSYLMLGDALL